MPPSPAARSKALHRTADPLSFPPHNADTLARLVAIAEAAGEIALGFFRPGAKTRAGVEWKGDGSPVTEADYKVNAFLEPRLKELWPGAAWLSEESADDPSRLGAERVIVVDPIDGTRGFSRGDTHWGIAIALVEAGRPVMAVVHAPALGQTYTAIAGGGAWLNGQPLAVQHQQGGRPEDMQVTCATNVATAMRSAGMGYDFKPKIASLALRIVMVASGVYTAGFTARDSHDWDLAAADLILQEAGGLLADLDGAPLIYNKPEPSHGVLTATPRDMRSTFRAALAQTPFG
jgi:myo-inositol-1(or 4)-monophosphatase